jgi:uncharacterized protein YcbK (DUF882 family)
MRDRCWRAPEAGPDERPRRKFLKRVLATALLPAGIFSARADAGVAPHYEVISGYRSPATNAMLHATGHAVSEHSLHMQGRAIDMRLRGYNLAAVRDLALAAKRGGVGYYPRSNFIHIDTGRVRKWQEE